MVSDDGIVHEGLNYGGHVTCISQILDSSKSGDYGLVSLCKEEATFACLRRKRLHLF